MAVLWQPRVRETHGHQVCCTAAAAGASAPSCLPLSARAAPQRPIDHSGGVQVTFDAPCRTTKYPREIPPLPWYRGTAAQMLVAGFLPFSAIYIELYYIFTSVWGHMDYTIYSVLFVVFCILLVVTATITVVLTYFQLAVEDHRWWWRSMLCGGSTSALRLCPCWPRARVAFAESCASRL